MIRKLAPAEAVERIGYGMPGFYYKGPLIWYAAAKDHCDTYHAADEDYFKQVWYWTTPTKECLDGRGPICTDYSQWV